MYRKVFTMALAISICQWLADLQAASAQHAHETDMQIGSTTSAGGSLKILYPFTEAGVVRVTPSALPGLFTSEDPGFTPALDDPPHIYELSLNTEVDLQLTAVDPGVSLMIGPTLLEEVGDSATIGKHTTAGQNDPDGSDLHRHPEFQLLLSTSDDDSFGEGRLSFRLQEGSGSSHGYGESQIYTFKVSNGYLPGLDDNDPDFSTHVACRKAVARQVKKLTGSVYSLLARCLDLATLAHDDPGTRIAQRARKACEVNAAAPHGLATKIAAARQSAFDKVDAKCGPLSSTSEPFTASAVKRHLGMAECRAQELAGATYDAARDTIAEVLGVCLDGQCAAGPHAGTSCTDDDDCDAHEDVEEALPCVAAAVGGE